MKQLQLNRFISHSYKRSRLAMKYDRDEAVFYDMNQCWYFGKFQSAPQELLPSGAVR